MVVEGRMAYNTRSSRSVVAPTYAAARKAAAALWKRMDELDRGGAQP